MKAVSITIPVAEYASANQARACNIASDQQFRRPYQAPECEWLQVDSTSAM